MKFLFRALITVANVIAFVFLHFWFKFVTKYPPGWGKITTYSIGVSFTYPFFLMHLLNGEQPENAYLLSFFGSGAGTVTGWMLEDVEDWDTGI